MIKNVEGDLHEWVLTVVSLNFKIQMHEVGRWNFKEVLRHFRAIRYEIERTRADGVKEDA